MPILEPADYRPPALFRQGDLATIVPALFRKVPEIHYVRTRIDTHDGDFLDLDIPEENPGSKTVGLILHGLEGNSGSGYVLGMCRNLHRMGMDAIAMNHCGCSGEINRNYRSYHSAYTQDLQTVLDWIAAQGTHERVILFGYSLGGGITLKYLGEREGEISPLVAGAMTVATPCDVTSSCMRLQERRNRVYLMRFIRELRKKAIGKKEQYPEAPYTLADVRRCRSFVEFDNMYTAPAHGFKDAFEYYAAATSHQYIPHIKVPTLLLNAQDDPFLTPSCFPFEEAKANPQFHLLPSPYGGHVGFATNYRLKGDFWMEQQARRFFEQVLDEKLPESALRDPQISS